jgi:uncharacterized protein (TIGR03000 family)
LAVPIDAKVFINDQPTKSRGVERNYVSRGILAGNAYDFRIRVEVVRDGKMMSSQQTLHLIAGDHRQLAFALPAERNLASLVSTR